jgi:histidine triad (HIT) family protein
MSLDGAYDPANIFAKILRGEVTGVKAYEDDVALAIMDLFPQAPGHTLVIPKYPAKNFLDLPTETVGPYLERVQKVARAVRRAFEPDGVLLTQFNGSAAGQSVFHVHFHIIPRWNDAKLGGHGQTKMADVEQLEAYAAKIAATI